MTVGNRSKAPAITELAETIRKLHGAKATHVKSVPVKETFKGQIVWLGTVEVFKLKGHPKTDRVYAWEHETDDPLHPKRQVTVLHIPPVTSPELAVRAAIAKEYRDREQQQEN
jgi:hypothetical protein